MIAYPATARRRPPAALAASAVVIQSVGVKLSGIGLTRLPLLQEAVPLRDLAHPSTKQQPDQRE
jgi:hypothetical protein